jgi:hypothetical protein
MKLNVLIFLLSISFCLSLNLKTFESAVDPRSITNTDGIDIIKILNLDRIKSTQNYIETQEAEVLKHKSIYFNLIFYFSEAD